MCTSEGEGGGVEYLVVVLGQLVQHPCVVGVELGQLLHNYKKLTYCGVPRVAYLEYQREH